MMKNLFTLIFLGTFCFTSMHAQAVGDYGSILTSGGDWNGTTTWGIWNGTSFAATTTPPDGSQNVWIRSGRNVTLSSSTINFGATLTMNGGALTVSNAGTILTMSNGSTITRTTTGNFGTASSGVINVGTSGNTVTVNITGTSSAGAELPTSAPAGKINLNISGGVTYSISSNRTVDNLTLDGTLGATTERIWTVRGNISGSGSADNTNIAVTMAGNTAASNISGVTFNDLTLNDADGFTLSGSPTVKGILTMSTGKLTLDANDLTIPTGGSIASVTSTKYIVTNAAGSLVIAVGAGASQVFPIGSSTSSYDPVTVTPTNATTFTASVQNTVSSPNDATKAVSRTWNLSATGAGTTNLSFTPATAALTGSNTPGTAVYGHFTTSWHEQTASYAGGTWSVTHPASAGFSSFGVGVRTAFAVTLPIELTNFKAKANPKSALLAWTTASEKDNALFNIEQSTNGTDFQNIGEVKGQGTTTATTNYNFEHATPSVGVNYYRLKQVDMNGEATYSAVRTVVFGKTGLIVKPTLVQEAVNVVVSDDAATTISIFNMSGQQVLTAKAQGEQRIDVSTLPIGLYMIRTATGDVARFMKQ